MANIECWFTHKAGALKHLVFAIRKFDIFTPDTYYAKYRTQ